MVEAQVGYVVLLDPVHKYGVCRLGVRYRLYSIGQADADPIPSRRNITTSPEAVDSELPPLMLDVAPVPKMISYTSPVVYVLPQS